jgi:hypothetical protein
MIAWLSAGTHVLNDFCPHIFFSFLNACCSLTNYVAMSVFHLLFSPETVAEIIIAITETMFSFPHSVQVKTLML